MTTRALGAIRNPAGPTVAKVRTEVPGVGRVAVGLEGALVVRDFNGSRCRRMNGDRPIVTSR